MADDRQLREMTCDPKFRKVLVTDGKTAVGQAVVRAVIGAGADLVWVGHAEPWKKFPGLAELEALPQVTLLPLDLTDSRSVKQTAARNRRQGRYPHQHRRGASRPRHRLAQRRRGRRARRWTSITSACCASRRNSGRSCASRGADGQSSATAWVNLLSIYALSNYPPHGTFSASKAAALSLSQCLRAEMRPGGVRVINVFPGTDRR